MTKFQAAQYDSFQAIRYFLAKNTADWSGLPPFVTAEALLQSLLTQLDAANAIHGGNITGATEQKADNRQELTTSILSLSSALCAMAGAAGNDVLELTVRTSRSELDRMSDDAFRGRVHRILQAADAHVAALAPYGFTPAQVAAVHTLFGRWCASEIRCIEVRAERGRATAEVARLIAETAALLSGTMDRLAVVIGTTNPSFAEMWTGLRRLEAPATSTRSLTVRATALAGGQSLPVSGAVAVINPGNVEKITGEEGMFYIQKLKPGAYTLSISKPGYAAPEPIAFVVAKGEMTEVEAVMVEE